MAEEKNVYRLQNLSCTSCAAKFEKNIRQIHTVEDVQLNFGASKLTVCGAASIEQLEQAGAFDGIKVFPEKQKMIKQHIPFWKKRENQMTAASLVLLLGGYGVSAANGGNNWLSIALFALAIAVGGHNLLQEGFKNLVKLQFDMSTLMTIAVIGAALIGDWAEGAVVVFLFSVSEALESYSIDKARSSISSLIEIAPSTAIVLRGGSEFEVEVEELQIGDVILIKPGQKIAMDGEVIEGDSSVNQAAITGESVPVHKIIGDEVFAGTLNEEGSLQVRVTKLAEDTTIAKIIHLVEEAQAEKAPTQQFVDRFAKYYTPAILVAAIAIMIVPPLFGGSWSEWFYRGLVVLVVGCPCALVISTPIAIVTAIGTAARNGVLIKGGVHLEETGLLKVVAFDKTGTLTEGQPEVTDVAALSNATKEELLLSAAAIEKFSQHPLAAAIIRAAEKQSKPLPAVTNFQSITGKGAKGELNGRLLYVGSPKLFNELQDSTEQIDQQVLELQKQGKTVMLVWSQEEVQGIIAVADQVRASSVRVIEKLKEIGIEKTVMLTGDNHSAAAAIGKKLGLSEVKAELLPEQKVEMIKELSKYGKTAMVGDGVNDAPALATAAVGVAMGGAGTDTALETADIALMADDLEKLPYTIRLSQRAKRVILQNVSIALGLKLIALLLIIPGWLTLWMAVVADMGATVIVVLNSLRLMRNKM